MRDGTKMEVDGTSLNDHLFYYKPSDFFLVHKDTGRYITSATKLRNLKELTTTPAFFTVNWDNLTKDDLMKLATAVQEWESKYSYRP